MGEGMMSDDIVQLEEVSADLLVAMGRTGRRARE
jgi:hypothetical protein